ncbi:MAG: hypothetical protein AAGJ08_05185 [Cyanobacteria bacterium P01_H01_bin.35]
MVSFPQAKMGFGDQTPTVFFLHLIPDCYGSDEQRLAREQDAPTVPLTKIITYRLL